MKCFSFIYFKVLDTIHIEMLLKINLEWSFFQSCICLLNFCLNYKNLALTTEGNQKKQEHWDKRPFANPRINSLNTAKQAQAKTTTTTTCLLSCLQSVRPVSPSMRSLLPQWLIGSCFGPSLQSQIRNLVSYLAATDYPMFPPLLTSIYDLATHVSRWGHPILSSSPFISQPPCFHEHPP